MIYNKKQYRNENFDKDLTENEEYLLDRLNKGIYFKEYKENYSNNLEIHKSEYTDNCEKTFINKEINTFKFALFSPIEKSDISLIDSKKKGDFNFDIFDLAGNHNLSYSKIIDFLEQRKIQLENENLGTIKTPTIPVPLNTLNWNGTQTEFIELVKALIENGNIKGTQTEIIKSLSNVFNIKINNENKLINDVKTRNNGSETLFIDKLKRALFDYITIEKKK